MDETSLEVQRALTQHETGRENQGHYGIRTEGALSFIVDAQGNKVSSGYHEFKVFRAQDSSTKIEAIVGKIGSMTRILKFEDGIFKDTPADFHELEYRADLDGLFLTNIGAMWYILDQETGEKSKDGYHEIYKKDGKMYGRTGNTVTEIKMQKKLSHTSELSLDSE